MYSVTIITAEVIFPFPFIYHQEQKVHEAMFKVLNLSGYVRSFTFSFELAKSRTFQDFLFKLCISVSISCRTCKEPSLKEWTLRADLCDALHEPVGGIKASILIRSFISSTMDLKSMYYYCTGQNCHGWEVHRPFRCLPLCSKGALSSCKSTLYILSIFVIVWILSDA